MFLIRWFLQTAASAAAQLRAHLGRSILTTLGVIIGVASVTTVIAALTGMKQFVLDTFETIGSRYVMIDGTLPEELRNKMDWRDTQLSIEEVRALQSFATTIHSISPIWFDRFDVGFGEETVTNVQVHGIWPNWHQTENRAVLRGRAFLPVDDATRRAVCLVNDKAIEELGLQRDPTGQFISLSGRRFLIVGLVETKEVSPMFGGGEPQTEVFVPFETARKISPRRWIRHASALLADDATVDEAEAEVRHILRTLRKQAPEEPDTFWIRALQSFIDGFNRVATTITLAAGAIVSISLIVGGVGIMNIMLVSVSERTREIGLRKAVGARPLIILTQFLVEAVTLCLVGGGIGLSLAQAIVFLMRADSESPLAGAYIPEWAGLLALGFSAVVGVTFGMFPAIKASRLDPIEALRHD